MDERYDYAINTANKYLEMALVIEEQGCVPGYHHLNSVEVALEMAIKWERMANKYREH